MSKTRILLAEDDPEHQQLLTRALLDANADLDLCIASSREELLEALGREKVDGLVLDFNLPPADAPQILKEAEGLLGDTPVIVISSVAAQSVVIESLRNGVADFVPKTTAIQGRVLWTRIESAILRTRRNRIDQRQAQRRLEKLNRVANQDPLTGLSNRRRAAQLLNSERNRKDRRQITSLVLFDLDHFKRINDEYGHSRGDKVLVGMADILRRHSGPSDAPIRWGGEEFLVIKGSTCVEAAWMWAEDVLAELRQTEFRCGVDAVKVSASAGIATLEASCLCEGSIELADRALYLAKDLGRDRICTIDMANLYAAALDLQCESVAAQSPVAQQLLRAVGKPGPTQEEHVGPHSLLVRNTAVKLGRMLSLEADDIARLEAAAMLHDVGKLAVPESLLSKAGALTAAERRVVDGHSRFGAEICTALGLEKPIATAVKYHHRRFDSIGPEESRTKDAILANIINVSDSFVAMTSDRAYARRRTKSEAMAELQRERGLQFDPRVVDTFIQASSACASG